ncbi:soluble calcium-activated nucleotidase 1-like [Artemia franciscana]
MFILAITLVMICAIMLITWCWNILIFKSHVNSFPFTPPKHTCKGLRYKIGIVSDLDALSGVGMVGTWFSHFKTGYLTIDIPRKKAYIEMDNGTTTNLYTNFSSGDSGMGLSELIWFDENLLAVDDLTGIIYIIDEKKAYPWVILADGHGKVSGHGFKGEWATVKDGLLYVGSTGKVWTNAKGEVLNRYRQWVKTISPKGLVRHHDWTENYKLLAKSVNTEHPGYLVHEACAWSNIHQKWVFLPRRWSNLSYNEKDDGSRGTNLVLIANENFSRIKVKHIDKVNPSRGFSSLKFIPGSNDDWIVALKSEELEGKTATYIMVFTMNGNIILSETQISSKYKFEGIEFI